MTQSASCSGRTCRGCYGEIAEIISDTDGLYTLQTKRLGSAHQLNVIWRVVGEQLEELLIKKKSGVILDFVHASIKVQKVERFNGTTREDNKPQLVLLPDFTSKYHLKNVLEMRDAHYHATVANTVNYTTVAGLAGTNRFVVEAAVKDSIREIGKYLQRNAAATLTIDIGVGFLEFQDRQYRMKWSPAFLGRLSRAGGAAETVVPYDPPSMTRGGPTAPCRYEKGCTSDGLLQTQVQQTLLAESRYTAAELNDGLGGSSYRRTNW